MPRPARTNLSPALAASAALHLGLAGLAFLSWREAAKQIPIPPVVPVTIVDAPPGEMRDTIQADEPMPAQSPTVEPAEPPPPPPQPDPAPPQPSPPTPPPRPAPSQARKPPPPAPARPQEQRLDLDALAKSLSRSRAPRSPPAPRRGPPKPAASPLPAKLSGSEAGMLRAKLERLWNPNCDVAGATTVVVRVRMRLNPDGRLTHPPVLISRSGAADDRVLDAAATRAVSATGQGAPYNELPAERYEAWKDITFIFNAKSACSR